MIKTEHDIIDNRDLVLADQVVKLLDGSSKARFALGFLFLPGLMPFIEQMGRLDELRLLIDPTSMRNCLEQLAAKYRHLDSVLHHIEAGQYPKRSLLKKMELEAEEGMRRVVGFMDHTDSAEAGLEKLLQLTKKGKFKVRLNVKGSISARAYIFDFVDGSNQIRGGNRDQLGSDLGKGSGAGIVGSTNLSLGSVSHYGELNVLSRGVQNHKELVRWFDELWENARPIEKRLSNVLENSWAVVSARPYDVYMKTLFSLVGERLDDEMSAGVLWDDDITRKLADFQRVAVEHAIQIIGSYGGVFVSDVVGLGKSFVGAAILKHFERTHRCRPLVVCPASLVEMWERYNEVYQLNARIVSMGKLREGGDDQGNPLLEDDLYRSRDFVLVDESHNFRHPGTQRYRVLEEYLGDGKRCCFLTATPRNKSAWDVYHQLKLFHQNERTDIPINPPVLHEYFKGIDRGTHRLHDLLANVLIRRTRRDILKWFGYDAETDERLEPARIDEYSAGKRRAYVRVADRRQFFPTRKLETIEYSIDEAYQGLYHKIRESLGGGSTDGGGTGRCLKYVRYGLWHYVKPSMKNDDRYAGLARSGISLRGLMRVLLFKRFESSVHAFRQTVTRLVQSHERFLLALSQGFVAAGEDAQQFLNDSGDGEERDLMESLRAVSGRFLVSDFDEQRLTDDVEHDISVLRDILRVVNPITPEADAKLQTLLSRLCSDEFQEGKCLIFTQYADTAKYLCENLISFTGREDIEAVCSGDSSRMQTIGRFAPMANPEARRRTKFSELNILVATDALSEGLNLQDANRIINYDLHWNPVRLIQRFGRIDRIGSVHDAVHGFNFLPETGIEEQLGLRETLENRIREIHESIGEDAAILDPGEQLNEKAMYSIYDNRGEGLESLEEEDDATGVDLNEATEMFREMKEKDPAEFQRIADLPDGIRSSMPFASNEMVVHCRAGRYQQLYLADTSGEIMSRDLPVVLSRLRCVPDTPALAMPKGYNAAVMNVKQHFVVEAEGREAERNHSVSLGRSQRYAVRELREFYLAIDDDDIKSRVSVIEQALRGSLAPALIRELNQLRNNQLTGQDLYAGLVELYSEFGLQNQSKSAPVQGNRIVPVVVASAAFVTGPVEGRDA